MDKVIIIAEAGVNHNGEIGLAKKLIDAAVEAGADYVKFQTFKAEKLVSKSAPKADYQKENMPSDSDSQLEMLKKLELDTAAHDELIQHCQTKGIRFLSTAFDIESVDLLDELGIELFKIPSGEITNLPYLEKIASKGKPIVLSTGMSNMGEIEDALEVLYEGGATRDNITVLHCNTEYPTPMKDVNLKAMLSIEGAFKVNVGYSDHTLGIEIPIAAVAMGAKVIEKHFTLDKAMEGPDHKASLEPHELKAMVKAIRNIELALSGTGVKRPSPSEKKNKTIARKSLYTQFGIKKGEVITREMLTAKRPGDGISPMQIDLVIGNEATRDISAGEKINYNDF